jgi:hypothetical protein
MTVFLPITMQAYNYASKTALNVTYDLILTLYLIFDKIRTYFEIIA